MRLGLPIPCRDKGLEFDVQLDRAIFAGDERDLMELPGNLIDNAGKYGGSEVKVQALQPKAAGGGSGSRWLNCPPLGW